MGDSRCKVPPGHYRIKETSDAEVNEVGTFYLMQLSYLSYFCFSIGKFTAVYDANQESAAALRLKKD